MKVLTNAEVLKHFGERDSVFDTPKYAQGDEDGLFYTHPEAQCFAIKYPPQLERLPFFARHIATMGYKPWDFRGALVWVTNFGMWDNAVEGIGYRIVEQMNRAAGQAADFEASQGREFRADELNEVVGMLLQPMIFAWDAFYLPQWSYGTGEFFVHISRNSHVEVVTKTKAFHDKIMSELKTMDYTVSPVSEGWTELLCRQAV